MIEFVAAKVQPFPENIKQLPLVFSNNSSGYFQTT